MPTPHTDDDVFPPLLKTATAAADPVLIRLSSLKLHTLLLAEDVTYEKSGAIFLHNVRWMQAPRRLLALGDRTGATHTCELVKLLCTPDHVTALLPNAATLRVPAHRRGFQLSNLSADMYMTYRTASARRLLQSVPTPARIRRPLLAGITALHRFRFAVRNALTPALTR